MCCSCNDHLLVILSMDQLQRRYLLILIIITLASPVWHLAPNVIHISSVCKQIHPIPKVWPKLDMFMYAFCTYQIFFGFNILGSFWGLYICGSDNSAYDSLGSVNLLVLNLILILDSNSFRFINNISNLVIYIYHIKINMKLSIEVTYIKLINTHFKYQFRYLGSFFCILCIF